MDRPLALYRRFLWEDKKISWVYTSALDQLFASRAKYFETCAMAQHMLTAAEQREVDDLIAAATLAAEAQVDRDAWGWTIRLPLRPWGIFCAVEPEGMVCARFTRLPPDTAKDPIGGFAVQRVSPNAPVRQSSLIPCAESTHFLVEQYFDESEQLPARIAIKGSEAVMALSTPDAEWDIVKNLPENDLLALFHELIREDADAQPAPQTADDSLSDTARRIKAQFAAAKGTPIGTMLGDLKLMHEAVFFYGCSCDIEKIRAMIDNLPADQKEELWNGTQTLDVQCPRCGRTHILTRN
ncbi:MAG: Hsp33 family molecular chaperone HslO [Proteobacteria bacterium]|nr:Hsp33 family molecular chaperone HslO [Pseudomonadota bacterium]